MSSLIFFQKKQQYFNLSVHRIFKGKVKGTSFVFYQLIVESQSKATGEELELLPLLSDDTRLFSSKCGRIHAKMYHISNCVSICKINVLSAYEILVLIALTRNKSSGCADSQERTLLAYSKYRCR